MKKLLLFSISLLLIASCTQKDTTPEASQANIPDAQVQKISVSSSIIPLSSVINTIGGDYVEVHNIIPAGVSPHGFDMSARDMAKLEKSEIVFMTGLEHIDGFLEKASSEKKQIHLADGIKLLEASGHDHDAHSEDEHSNEHAEDEHHNEHVEEHSEEEHHDDIHNKDPHVWLGKDNIIKIAGKVRDELSKVLPQQAEYFSKNTETFIEDIETIFADFETQTSTKTPGEFIVFHDAYNYLFESIQLDNNLKVPFSENVLHETGTAHMAELIQEVELHGIKYIFREPQFSDTNLKKFQEQYNLSVHTLDPIGTDDSANGYMTNLKSNLESLRNIYE